MVDVFHTLFGVAGTFRRRLTISCPNPLLVGMSILGYPGLVDLDPVYCMPASTIESKGLRKPWKSLERRLT